MTTNPDADLTRKQRRDQARDERKSSEQAAAARAGARRQRLIQLGGVVGLAVVIVAAILIATGGGSKKKVIAKPTSPQAVQAIATVKSLLDGIPQKANVLGKPNAPVTLVYFGDLECPICRDFTTSALPSIIKTYVRPGKLKIEYLSMQTATHEPETFKTQQVAAYAAGKQNLAWYFIEL
ncbi:MAG TPA: thioredoxin domain-containing protein, partial [Solirubrobacteraceae bacterium]